MLRIQSFFFVLSLCALIAPTARAQVEGEGGAEVGADVGVEAGAAGEEGGGDVALSDEQALQEEQRPVGDDYHDPSDPFEDPAEGYFFAGLFYRHIFMPEFLINLFMDESTGASQPGFGAEVTYRKAGFDIIGSLWWQGYNTAGPFRAAGDPLEDTEWIESEMSIMYLAATFLWSTEFNEMFALEYGVGIGIGLVLGDSYRTEAYQVDGGWAKCNGPNDPPIPGFCEPGPVVADGADGAHYGAESNFWSEGGDWPNVWLWAAIPHLALRFKPVRQFMMRLEGGFSTGGFFMGAAANYGF